MTPLSLQTLLLPEGALALTVPLLDMQRPAISGQHAFVHGFADGGVRIDGVHLVQEEQFGPVLPVLSYSNLEDVIAKVNASPFGLGGSVWSADVDRAMHVAMRIESGTVWVNQHMAVDNTIPFRGAKQSGLGGELGQEGLHEYSQPTVINAVALSRS